MNGKITEITAELVRPIVEDMKLKLVDVEFAKEGKERYLRVFVDRENGGVDLDQCALVSEKLSAKLDEVNPIDEPYFLEVSSPGAERPLREAKDFYDSLGKGVYLKTYEKIEGKKVFEGILEDFDGQTIVLAIKEKGKQKRVELPYDSVAKARLAVLFS